MVSSANFRSAADLKSSEEAFEEERMERMLQREAGILDEGQSDYDPEEALDRLCSSHGSTPTCFSRVCSFAGFQVGNRTTRASSLTKADLVGLSAFTKAKIYYVVYSDDDSRNHLITVDSDAKTAAMEVKPVGNSCESFMRVGVTTYQELFNKGGRFFTVAFYSSGETPALVADEPPVPGSFGSLSRQKAQREEPQREATAPAGLGGGHYPESVVADDVFAGGSNVSGGVARPKRRVVGAKVSAFPTGPSRSYRVSNGVAFNNVEEMFQDTISREFAQEIMEDLFKVWKVPFDQPSAMRYAEDLLLAFLISTTASNKADYDKDGFVIPIEPEVIDGQMLSELDVGFKVFSDMLSYKYGKTRRQFSRAVADQQRRYLKEEENIPLLPSLANRVGCEPMLAYLAFDGSTHCSSLTTRERTFTRTLESRNLFEDDSVIANGASERLMQGFSGGPRSIVPR